MNYSSGLVVCAPAAYRGLIVMLFSFSWRGTKALGAFSAGLVLMLGLIAATSAHAEPRVALVIGNSNYQGDMPVLPNPERDAKLMARTLKELGFDVIDMENATQDQLKQAISDFGNRLAAAGRDATGLFFYAGHGIQVNGENYLIPIDAKLEKEADADLNAVKVSSVQSQMTFADNAVNVIVLDACRDNPLKGSSRGVKRGLAEIDAVNGMFVAYSTSPGDTAADGDGANSPYTAALAQALKEPGLSIGDVFQEVRSKVLAETGNTQRPWDSSSLTGRFYFKAGDATQTASLTPPPAAAPAAAPAVQDDSLAKEKTYWESVKDSDDPDQIQLYLNRYPKGYFVELANAKIDQLKGGAQVASADTSGQNAAPKAATNDGTRIAAPSDVSFVAQNQTVYAKGGGQVRTAPESGAGMVAKLQTNTEVTATGISADGKWWRVTTADGQTGYMHKTVVSEQPVQMASAAPTQPAASQTRAVDADAFQTTGAASAAPAPATGDVAAQLFQGLANSAAQQLGLPGIGGGSQQQAAQDAANFTDIPINETVKVRAGAAVFDRPGGRQIFQATKSVSLLASAKSSDGRWYQVALPNGGTGYIARQSLGK